MFPHGFRVFLGLFWMTAPLAWLYALPAERLLGLEKAAAVNVALLGVVTVWRVVLLAQATAIVFGVPFARSLSAVAVPSALMACVVGLLAPFALASRSRAHAIPPESTLVIPALLVALAGGAIALAIAVFALRSLPRASPTAPRLPQAGRIPLLLLTGLVSTWILIAIVPQRKVRHTLAMEELVRRGECAAALAYASQLQPDDFTPVRRLPPNPYYCGINGALRVPTMLAALTGDEPTWLRDTYLGYADILIGRPHRLHGIWRDQEEIVRFLHVLSRYPEGRAWAQAHEADLHRIAADTHEAHLQRIATDNRTFYLETDDTAQRMAQAFERLGIQLDLKAPEQETAE